MFPADSSCPQVLASAVRVFRFRLRDSHPLRSAFPDCSAILPQSRISRPLPRSLAATYGISVDFSSSGYLDVSVPRVPRVQLFYSLDAPWFFTKGVAPFGHPRISAYLQLPAAFRS